MPRRLARLAPLLLAAAVAACNLSGEEEGAEALAPKPPPREVRLGTSTAGVCGVGAGKHLYWGDLHTHTAYSADAYAFRTRASPAEAYAFARGAPIVIASGTSDGGWPTAQLQAGRLLDFNAVTDHSEWLPTAYGCGVGTDGGAFDPSSPYWSSPYCTYVRSNAYAFGGFTAQGAICDGGTPMGANCVGVTRSAWQSVQQAAEAAYQPCTFTTFNAYEWTYSSSGDTLHRNVIFGGTDVPDVPFDALDYTDPVQLWTALDTGCDGGSACQALTIPHNSNQSGGNAFLVPGTGGAAVITQMQKYQRLVEIFQHKGNSECYYDAGSTQPLYQDPSCLFEVVDQGSADYVPASYVRSGLALGIAREAMGLRNHLRLGLVGATDTHNATSGNVDEATFPGHVGTQDRDPATRLGSATLSQFNPGGLTGVWADENTRSAIYDALYNRESFATSGPRIAVRFYQTWSPQKFCVAGSFPDNVLDAGAIPMGGTFDAGTDGGAPYFVISVAADVADLAEVDLIKSDVSGGALRSWVWRRALDGGTDVDAGMILSNRAPCVWIRDPTYVPSAPAVYYARVLEVPTPRWSWTACDTLDAGVVGSCDDGGLRTSIQERAWTSPIWSVP